MFLCLDFKCLLWEAYGLFTNLSVGFSMKNQKLSLLAVVSAVLLALFGCAPSGGGDSSSNSDTEVSKENIVFNYRFHESLPSEWTAEVAKIFNNLEQITPTPQVSWFPSSLNVYAWVDNVSRPFGEQYSGICICGNGEEFWMSLEMSAYDLASENIFRYSVIAHEYFHVYQATLFENFVKSSNDPNGFDIYWLKEGSAEAFQSLYAQQYYGVNVFSEHAGRFINEGNLSEPSNYESYNIEDRNGVGLFLTLALVKELEANGASTENAFKIVLKDFWLNNPSNLNWKTKFQEVFGFDVESFYSNLSKYSADPSNVYPSTEVTLQNIFIAE